MKNQKSNSANEIIEQITADRLESIIKNRNFTIIDVRDQAAIQSQGSIPGAVNVPLKDMDSELGDHQHNQNSLFQEDQSFLFCCTGGVMSYMAALKAQKKGITRVFNLEGGHSAWMKFKQNQDAA